MRRAAASLALVFALALVPRSALAQCGAKRSTCSGCHDGARAPAPGPEAWHRDHAFADLCPVCHGGAGEEIDPTLAHAGMARPLGEGDEACAACASCHGAETPARVARYRAARLEDAGAPAPAAGGPASPPLRAPPPSREVHPHGEPGPNLALGALVAAVGAAGGLFVALHERARRQRPPRPAAST